MGSLRALRAARERIRELVNDLSGPAAAADVLLVAYLDDVLLGVPAEACAEALRILHEELAAVRHFPSWSKLEIWSPAGTQPPGLPSEAATAWRPEGLTVLGLPLPASPSSRRGPSEPGGEDAGLAEEWLDAAAASAGPAAAAGSERFVESFVRARVQAAEHLADLVVRAVDEGEAGDPTAQVAGLLLRLCVLPRVLHLFRGHYARSLLPLASEFDDMMRTMAARVWRTSPNWRRKVELQVRLPLRWGGMGLRPIAEVAPAAYLGSWAQVLPLVQGALGGAPLLGPEAPPSSTASTVQDAVNHWQELAGRPGVEPVDWATVLARPKGLRRQQRVLSQAIDRNRRATFLRVAPPADRARVQNCAGIWASVWLTVTPSEHGLSFLDVEYSALCRFRLRVPQLPGGCRCGRATGRGPPRRGSVWYDPEGDHAHACSRNSGPRTRRHGHLRDELSRQLQWLGFWTQREQSDSRLLHRPDVRADGFSLPTAHFEVYVPHPSPQESRPEQLRRAQSPAAFIEAQWAARLERDYGGGPPRNAAFDLVPAAVSSYGSWHPAFARWWRGAVRAAAERYGPTASQTGMMWRTVGFLSVILQRQNFHVLIGCAPTLEALVVGRLGRPLSEDPEFWRAAPEAALSWGEEEFDFPPQRRGGEEPRPEDFGDQAAGGHLRAAGLRL